MKAEKLSRLIGQLNDAEKRFLLKQLLCSNSKFGNKNKYIELYHQIQIDSVLAHSSEAKDIKRNERLYVKIFESLSTDFSINRPNSYNLNSKNRILAKRYELFSQIAWERDDDDSYEFFLKRAIKVLSKSESLIDMKRLSSKLGEYYLSRRRNNDYIKNKNNLLAVSGEVRTAESLLHVIRKLHSLIHGYSTIKFNESESEWVLSEYKRGSKYVRVRRLQLFAILSLVGYSDRGLSQLTNKQTVLSVINELKESSCINKPFYSHKDHALISLNESIANCLLGNSKRSLELSLSAYNMLKGSQYQQQIALKHIIQMSYYEQSTLPKDALNEIDKNNEELCFLLAVINTSKGSSSISEFNYLTSIRSKSSEFDFYSRVYSILCALIKQDYDFVEFQVTNISSLFRKTKDSSKNLILKLLQSWAKKGFQGQIQDLPKEIINPLKEHYENTWNPLSADMIPLHLWHNPRGLPNHKEVYAHLFECKRKKTLEQGLFID